MGAKVVFTNAKWVTAFFRIETSNSEAVEIQQFLGPYAKKFGWVVKKNPKVHEDTEERYIVEMAPKEGVISPEFLLDNIDLFDVIAICIWRDILYGGNFKRQETNLTKNVVADPFKPTVLVTTFLGLFHVRIDLEKAVLLERRNYYAFKEAFGLFLDRWYVKNWVIIRKFFVTSKTRARAQEIVDLLTNAGVYNQ